MSAQLSGPSAKVASRSKKTGGKKKGSFHFSFPKETSAPEEELHEKYQEVKPAF